MGIFDRYRWVDPATIWDFHILAITESCTDIDYLAGFVSDGIGLSNLCFGVASIIVSYFYPSLTSLIVSRIFSEQM